MDFIVQKAYAASINNSSGSNNGITFDKLFTNIKSQIVTPLIYLLFALATVYFIWGVMVFVKNAASPEERAKGFQHIIWGLIGMFIMVSAKGLINIILATFGLK